MGDAAVDYVGFRDTRAEGGNAGLHLGEHAAGDDATLDQPVDLVHGQVSHETLWVVRPRPNAVGVGDDDQLFGLHGGGHRAGCRVGVHVQPPTRLVAGDRRYAGDRVGLHQQLQQPRVDTFYFANVAQVDPPAFRPAEIRLLRKHHVTAERVQAHRLTTLALDEVHNELIDFI